MESAVLAQFIVQVIIYQQLDQARHSFRPPDETAMAQVVNAVAAYSKTCSFCQSDD